MRRTILNAAAAALSLAATPSASGAQLPPRATIQAMVQVAHEVCERPSLFFYSRGGEASGEVGISLPRVLARLADLNGKVGVRGNVEVSQGLLPKDRLAAVLRSSDCAERVFDRMWATVTVKDSSGRAVAKPRDTRALVTRSPRAQSASPMNFTALNSGIITQNQIGSNYINQRSPHVEGVIYVGDTPVGSGKVTSFDHQSGLIIFNPFVLQGNPDTRDFEYMNAKLRCDVDLDRLASMFTALPPTTCHVIGLISP